MFSKFHKIFDVLTALERQVFEGALAVFAVSLLLNGANVFYRETVLTPIGGGVYIEGLVGQPIALNPILAVSDVDRDINELIYLDLLELSESRAPSADGREWAVILKENLFWSDGEPLGADDVIFTIETIQSPEASSPLSAAWQSVSVEKISDREIRFALKTPYAFFEENLADLKIVPKHIFGTIPAANLRLSDYNLEPVGNGPYRFASYKKRKDGFILEYRFAANEKFSGDKPLIEEFVFKFFPLTYETALAAFNRREINGLGGMPPERLKDIKVGHRVNEIRIPRYYAIFMNQSTSQALRDREVRTALALAVPREKILEQALSGRGVLVDGPLYPESEGYIPDSDEGRKENPELAEAILEEDGWGKSADGIREKLTDKENVRLEFNMVVPEIDFLVSTARLLEAAWKEIGAQVELTVLKPAAAASEAIRTRNYNMILFGNILKDSSDVFSFWHSSERFYPGLNLALYENKKVDELLERIRKTPAGPGRIQDLEALQAIIREDMPAIFLFSPNYLYVSTKDLGGLSVPREIAAPADRLNGVQDWYLKTARVFRAGD